MRKLLVFQHVPFEILGTLDPMFRRAGFRIRYVNFGRYPDAKPDLEGYRGLVVLGGPMNVDEEERYPHLRTEVELLRRAVERGMPVLGICLGAQLLAKALGARVRPNGTKEIGWYPVEPTDSARQDPLFRHFGPREWVFQWHGDAFEVPEGGVLLARGETCANQAFRFGERAYGLQFHLEVDEPLVERWLRVPAHREELATLGDANRPETIRAETPHYLPRLSTLARNVFGSFIELFGLPPKRTVLPSR